jgi:hypothetical protein
MTKVDTKETDSVERRVAVAGASRMLSSKRRLVMESRVLLLEFEPRCTG